MPQFLLQTRIFDRESGQQLDLKYDKVEYASTDSAKEGLRALNTEKPRAVRRFKYRLWPLGDEIIGL